jgi:outer membrane protein W
VEDLAFWSSPLVDDDLGLGLQLNVEVPIGSRDHWSFVAGLRLVKLLMESEVPGQDLDLNPIVPTVGIGYRF